MAGPETADAKGVVQFSSGLAIGKRLERQGAMKERQPSLKWLGRNSPKGTPDSSPPRDPNKKPVAAQQEAYELSNANASANLKESNRIVLTARTRASSEIGRGSKDLSGKEDDPNLALHELFKKEFIEKLAEKVKQRPAYVPANKELVKPVKAHPKLLKRAESSEGMNFMGSPKRDAVELAVKSGTLLQRAPRSPSHDRGRSSPIRDKFRDPDWMKKLSFVDNPKQSWSSSKDVEETSKDFILTKYFQTPTKATPTTYGYDTYCDEEVMSPMGNPPQHAASSTKSNVAQRRDNVRRQLLLDEEVGNMGQIVPVSDTNGRRGNDSHSGKTMGASLQNRKNALSYSRSSRALTLSEDLKTSVVDSSYDVVDRQSRENKYKASTRPIDEQMIKDEVVAPKLLSYPGQNDVEEFEAEQILKEKESMMKTLKMAAAVDQAHFLRALQDNGAVQSSDSTMRNGYVEQSKLVGNARLQLTNNNHSRPSSPNSLARNGDARGNTLEGRRDSFGARTREQRENQLFQTEQDSDADSASANSKQMTRTRPSREGQADVLPRSRELWRWTSSNSSRSCESPTLSRQSSHRSSILSDETSSSQSEIGSSAGGSIIQKLMRKANQRNGSNPPTDGSIPWSSNSLAIVPVPETTPEPARQNTGLKSPSSESSKKLGLRCQESDGRGGNTSSEGSLERSSSEHPLLENLSDSTKLGSKTWSSRVNPVFETTPASGAAEEPIRSNALRVNVHVRATPELHPRPPCVPDIKKPTGTPERTVSSSSGLWSPGSDDSGSEASCIEQPSPISVLYNGRTPFQEESRLSPLEQKLQELHERINKSKTDVSNQKRANLERIKALARDRKVTHPEVIDLKENKPLEKPLLDIIQASAEKIRAIARDHKVTDSEVGIIDLKDTKSPGEPLVDVLQTSTEKIRASARDQEVTDSESIIIDLKENTAPKNPKPLVDVVHASVEKESLAIVVTSVVTANEKVEDALSSPTLGDPVADFCTSLETADLNNIVVSLSCTSKYWDLVYVRDVLVASSFGQDKLVMTKWHSVVKPMDPCLFQKLEDFYKKGTTFSGSQFLNRLVPFQADHVKFREHIRINATTHLGAIEAMNRCQLFDVVNEILAKKLAPYTVSRNPWMEPFAQSLVRPRPTGNLLLQEIWTEIYNQIGENGSMTMGKAELHQSLEDLISEDLFKRSVLFPCQEVERAAERIGREIEQRIFGELLEEIIFSLGS